MSLTPKARFMKVISLQKVDRPPVACCNQTATVEQMEKLGIFWPYAHKDAEKMAKLAAAAWEQTGLESIGVPFCQTVEAEILGCKLKWEDKKTSIPSVPFEGYSSPREVKIPENMLERGRMPVVLRAIEILKELYGEELPILGHINGPFSLSAHLAEPAKLMRMIIQKPDMVGEFCNVAVEVLAEYGNAMFEHGADVVVIEDMVASVDMVGPKFYEDFAAPYDKNLVDRLKGPNILHICGNTDSIIDAMINTGTDCLSIDSNADAKNAVDKTRGKAAIAGNVDALYALLRGTVEQVRKSTIESLKAGVDIVAPACSLSPLNNNANIKAMVETVKQYSS